VRRRFGEPQLFEKGAFPGPSRPAVLGITLFPFAGCILRSRVIGIPSRRPPFLSETRTARRKAPPPHPPSARLRKSKADFLSVRYADRRCERRPEATLKTVDNVPSSGSGIGHVRIAFWKDKRSESLLPSLKGRVGEPCYYATSMWTPSMSVRWKHPNGHFWNSFSRASPSEPYPKARVRICGFSPIRNSMSCFNCSTDSTLKPI